MRRKATALRLSLRRADVNRCHRVYFLQRSSQKRSCLDRRLASEVYFGEVGLIGDVGFEKKSLLTAVDLLNEKSAK